ncbi:hypothetical protein F5H01DRAFT_323687 [Linnemannia elongata]|nr:hypothetical protein F5H01DRAFT_323687 [Linnemannia elongata]
MSDHTDNAPLSLASFTPEDLAKIKALLLLDSPPQSTTTVDLPRTKQLIITDYAKELIPAISGEHFFFPPDDPEEDTIEPKDTLFHKNPLQQYHAPGWELPFPVDRNSPYHHFEQALVKIIERQAHSTRPLDDFAVDFLANVTDTAARNTVAEFLQVMRSQLAINAREIQELRTNNYLRAKGLQPVPEKKKGVNTSQEAIRAHIKGAQEYANVSQSKKPEGGSGREDRGGRGGRRSWGNDNFHFGQQQYQRPYYQQHYQQPQYQQYPGAYQTAPSTQQQQQPFGLSQGYSEFSGNEQYPQQGFPRSNRGRGRGRGQSYQ